MSHPTKTRISEGEVGGARSRKCHMWGAETNTAMGNGAGKGIRAGEKGKAVEEVARARVGRVLREKARKRSKNVTRQNIASERGQAW